MRGGEELECWETAVSQSTLRKLDGEFRLFAIAWLSFGTCLPGASAVDRLKEIIRVEVDDLEVLLAACECSACSEVERYSMTLGPETRCCPCGLASCLSGSWLLGSRVTGAEEGVESDFDRDGAGRAAVEEGDLSWRMRLLLNCGKVPVCRARLLV